MKSCSSAVCVHVHVHVYNTVKDTNCSLIEEMMEDIVCPESLLPSLLVAKDEVNPLVKMGRHIVTLKSLVKGEKREEGRGKRGERGREGKGERGRGREGERGRGERGRERGKGKREGEREGKGGEREREIGKGERERERGERGKEREGEGVKEMMRNQKEK